MRDRNLRKKSFKFGDVVEELISEKSKNEKAKEQNDKLLRMAGKETQVSGNDQVEVINNGIERCFIN